MARRPSQRDDAVTTEPVSDFDVDDQFVGGTDLSTALCIFTFLFILSGIGFVYYNLRTQYDIGRDEMDHYPGYVRDARGEKIGQGGDTGGGGGEGGEEPAAEPSGDTPAPEGGEKPAESGDEKPAESGSDDGFGD